MLGLKIVPGGDETTIVMVMTLLPGESNMSEPHHQGGPLAHHLCSTSINGETCKKVFSVSSGDRLCHDTEVAHGRKLWASI